MALRISQGKRKIARETSVMVQRLPLCIMLGSHSISLWLKGKQTHFGLDYESMFHLACKKAWEATKKPARRRRRLAW